MNCRRRRHRRFPPASQLRLRHAWQPFTLAPLLAIDKAPASAGPPHPTPPPTTTGRPIQLRRLHQVQPQVGVGSFNKQWQTLNVTQIRSVSARLGAGVCRSGVYASVQRMQASKAPCLPTAGAQAALHGGRGETAHSPLTIQFAAPASLRCHPTPRSPPAPPRPCVCYSQSSPGRNGTGRPSFKPHPMPSHPIFPKPNIPNATPKPHPWLSCTGDCPTWNHPSFVSFQTSQCAGLAVGTAPAAMHQGRPHGAAGIGVQRGGTLHGIFWWTTAFA